MTASTDNFKEVVLSKKVQVILQSPKAPTMKNFTNRNFEGEIMNTGDTVTIIQPDYASVVTGLSESTDSALTGAIPKAKKLELKIDKDGDFAFKLPDRLTAMTKFNYKEGCLAISLDKLGRDHALEISNLLLNSNDVKSVAGTASAPLYVTKDNVVQVVFKLAKALFENGATSDMMGGYSATKSQAMFDSETNKLTGYTYETVDEKAVVQLPPDIYELLVLTLGVDRDTVGADSTLVNAEIKRLLGLNIECDTTLDTNNTEKVTVTGAVSGLQCMLAGTKNAVTFASMINKIETLRDQGAFVDIVRGKEYYGYKLYQPDAVVKAFLTTIEPEIEEPTEPTEPENPEPENPEPETP